jgi:hypothetical protein
VGGRPPEDDRHKTVFIARATAHSAHAFDRPLEFCGKSLKRISTLTFDPSVFAMG